ASAGVRAAEAVHIGDHPLQDIYAACAAGMRTIWVNRAAEPWPGPEAAGDAGTPAAPGADAELRHFSELPALLERLAGEH
ncbi:HAD hydrolase-like protein, partial [Acinetobacter baumannii]